MGGRKPWDQTAAAQAGQLLLRQLRAEAKGEEIGRLAKLEVKTRPPDPPLELMKSWME